MRLPHDTHVDNRRAVQAQPLNLRGKAGADGSCTVISDPVPLGYHWLIDYLVSTVKSTGAPAVSVYDDTADLFNLLDGTTAGSSAVALYSPPRIITQGRALAVVWTGCNPGDACQLRVEHRVVEG